MMSFVDALAKGIAISSDINQYRDRWSLYLDDSQDIPVYEYLGLSLNDYCRSQGLTDVFETHAIICKRQMELGILPA